MKYFPLPKFFIRHLLKNYPPYGLYINCNFLFIMLTNVLEYRISCITGIRSLTHSSRWLTGKCWINLCLHINNLFRVKWIEICSSQRYGCWILWQGKIKLFDDYFHYNYCLWYFNLCDTSLLNLKNIIHLKMFLKTFKKYKCYKNVNCIFLNCICSC